jgi:tetratricopeptide (TPR) repeat protein
MIQKRINPKFHLPDRGALQHFWRFGLLSAAIFLVYSNSMNGILVLDDNLLNYTLNLDSLLEKVGRRKLAYLSFMINHKINGYDPFYFRLFNILIHICNTLLVYVLSLKTLNLYRSSEKDESLHLFIALSGAALFALHPLNINAVAYIIQRMASLATLFVLISLITYIIAAKSEVMMHKTFWYTATALSVVLGIFSKENAVMAIPLILLYDFIFLSQHDKKVFMKKARFILGIGCLTLFFMAFFIPIHKITYNVLKSFTDIRNMHMNNEWMAIDAYWSPLEHILTEFRVINRYLFLVFLPLPGLLVFDWWGYPVSKGLFEPATTALSILIVTLLIVFSVLKLKKYPFLSFGILWYFISISLESFIAVGSDLYFEHRNYLPLTGLCFGLCAETIIFLKGKLHRAYVIWIMFFILSALLGMLTLQRNLIWKDQVVFWKDIVHKAPENIRAHIALGNILLGRSDFRNAEVSFLTALELSRSGRHPRFLDESLYSLGLMYVQMEQQDKAGNILRYYKETIPDPCRLKILNGFFYYGQKQFDNAILALRDSDKCVFRMSDRVIVYTLLGDANRGKGLVDRASESYQNALHLDRSFSPAYLGMANVHLMKGDIPAAIAALKTGLSKNPYNVRAISEIAYLLLIRDGKTDEAMFYAKKAVSFNPPFYMPYIIMATILNAQGKSEEAEGFYDKAVSFHAPSYLIYFNKALACSLKGDREKQKFFLREVLKLKETPANISAQAKHFLSGLQ